MLLCIGCTSVVQCEQTVVLRSAEMWNFLAAECGKAITDNLRNVPHLIFHKLPLETTFHIPHSAKYPRPASTAISAVPASRHVLDGYWTTRRYANSRIANSRTRQLAYWTSRGLDNSRMPPASFRSFGGICETTSCPVRELTDARVVQSASCSI